MSFGDCPICLDAMKQIDIDHPLQCETHCGYNFCMNCIESLITSSKDDYMEASDGNRHVKVFLHCPNCRAELSHTIRDTLLLRKADAVLQAIQRKTTSTGIANSYDDDNALSASQLQLMDALQQPQVQAAIVRARRMEAAYLGREYKVVETKQQQQQQQQEVEYEEWGVEMDLVRGVHQSFRMPKPPTPRAKKEQPRTKVDASLFPGLDYFLSDDERIFVTDLMTRGEPDKLVEAARILHSIAHNVSTDSMPDNRKPLASSSSNNTQNPKTLFKHSSVFQLIAESEEAHKNREVRETKKILGKNSPMPLPAAVTRASEHRTLERDLKKQAHFQKLFPIPVRMPKVIEIDLRDKFDMQFVDHEWDGTVMDAYSKLSIGYGGSVTQKRPQNSGVPTVLGENGTSGDIQIELPGQPRILISHAGRVAGQQGAMKGDVVTHMDGDSLLGIGGADKLWMRINAAKQRGHATLTITLNAERSVAEALKRRAIAIAAVW